MNPCRHGIWFAPTSLEHACSKNLLEMMAFNPKVENEPQGTAGWENLSGKGAVKSHKPCYEHLLHSLAGRHCSPENTSSTHVNSWLMQKEMFFVESLSYLLVPIFQPSDGVYLTKVSLLLSWETGKIMSCFWGTIMKAIWWLTFLMWRIDFKIVRPITGSCPSASLKANHVSSFLHLSQT